MTSLRAAEASTTRKESLNLSQNRFAAGASRLDTPPSPAPSPDHNLSSVMLPCTRYDTGYTSGHDVGNCNDCASWVCPYHPHIINHSQPAAVCAHMPKSRLPTALHEDTRIRKPTTRPIMLCRTASTLQHPQLRPPRSLAQLPAAARLLQW